MAKSADRGLLRSRDVTPRAPVGIEALYTARWIDLSAVQSVAH